MQKSKKAKAEALREQRQALADEIFQDYKEIVKDFEEQNDCRIVAVVDRRMLAEMNGQLLMNPNIPRIELNPIVVLK